jgi:hypothetical protein
MEKQIEVARKQAHERSDGAYQWQGNRSVLSAF